MIAFLAGCVLMPSQAAPMPQMMSRADWGAKPPVLKMEPHKITKITVHHTGVRQDPDRDFVNKLQGLQTFSQRDDKLADGRTKPQWTDIPYHYYIDVNGEIAECRPIELPGDTNTSYETRGHALVVVEGWFPLDYFNIRQRRSLDSMVLWLAGKYKVPSEDIQGHMDYAPGETDCPGTSIHDYLPTLRAKSKEMYGR
ncbi:MAG: peptidoglycan recognition family protein [Fimbriimonadaceae bacterium]